jgi:hypothetical protein
LDGKVCTEKKTCVKRGVVFCWGGGLVAAILSFVAGIKITLSQPILPAFPERLVTDVSYSMSSEMFYVLISNV